MKKDTNASFDLVKNLSADLIPTALHVTAFCGRFLAFDGSCSYFDWVGFISQCAFNPHKGSGLVYNEIHSTRISQQTQSIGTLCDSIGSWMGGCFNLSLDTRQLSAMIENVFTNLREVSSSSCFLGFSSKRELANSAWEYRVLFAHTDPKDSVRFQVLIVTITISANIVEKKSWGGLSKHTKKNFGAHIIGAVLDVEKGFRNTLT